MLFIENDMDDEYRKYLTEQDFLDLNLTLHQHILLRTKLNELRSSKARTRSAPSAPSTESIKNFVSFSLFI